MGSQHLRLGCAAATALFKKAERNEVELHLSDTILSEVIFVMEKVYQRQRTEIADALLDLIHNPGITLQGTAVTIDALLRYRAHAVDFPDALVAAMAVAKRVPAISFDRDFNRFGDVTRFEPK